MVDEWLSTSWSEVALVLVSTVAIFVAVITYTRVVGLRSFSKMSSFDFAMTVAVGSVMATVATSPSATLLNGLVGLAGLFGFQYAVARLRRRSRHVARLVDNQPLLLMEGGRLLPENLDRARVTEADVRAKLREANVLDLGAVRAVVLETTGDISVMHGDGPVDRQLLTDVRRGAEADPVPVDDEAVLAE